MLIDEIEHLKAAFWAIKTKHPFKIDAIVILPDHFHLLMTLPKNDSNYSQRLNLIKGYFSRAIERSERISISRKKKRERGIWQRRFWEHLIRHEDDDEKHVHYIHYNPVKHACAQNPSDWPYSSIHQHIAQGLLSANWAAQPEATPEGFGE